MEPVSITLSSIGVSVALVKLVIEVSERLKLKASGARVNLTDGDLVDIREILNPPISKVADNSDVEAVKRAFLACAVALQESYKDFQGTAICSLSVTQILVDDAGEMVGSLECSNIEIAETDNETVVEEKSRRVIVDIGSMKSDEDVGSEGVVVAYVVEVTASFTDVVRYSPTPEAVLAVLLLLGVAVARMIDSEAEAGYYKIGCEEDMRTPDYRKRTTLMVGCMWPDTIHGRARDLNSRVEAMANMGVVPMHEAAVQLLNDLNKNIERNVILVGETGSGKSNTGNMLISGISGRTGNVFRVSSLGTGTSNMDGKVAGDSGIKIWDTPGLNDQYKRDKIFVKKISDNVCYMVTVSVLVICIENCERFKGTYGDMMVSYREIFFDAFQGVTLIAVTRQANRLTSSNKLFLRKSFKSKKIMVSNEDIFDINMSDAAGEAEARKLVQRVVRLCNLPPRLVGVSSRLEALIAMTDTLGVGAQACIHRSQVAYTSINILMQTLARLFAVVPKRATLLDGAILLRGRASNSNNAKMLCYLILPDWPEGFWATVKAVARLRQETALSGRSLSGIIKYLMRRDIVFVNSTGQITMDVVADEVRIFVQLMTLANGIDRLVSLETQGLLTVERDKVLRAKEQVLRLFLPSALRDLNVY